MWDRPTWWGPWLPPAVALLPFGCLGDPGSLGSDRPGADPSSAESGAEASGGADTGPAPRLDLGTGTPEDLERCGCTSPERGRYVWIANIEQSTVSKIEAATTHEVGRYRTHPEDAGAPSRTSVSLSGRAVAVANRNGGVIKIWSSIDDCVDRDQDGVIDTSGAAADVRPFGADECVAWYRGLEYDATTPVAWTCVGGQELVWTAGVRHPAPGTDAEPMLDADVLLLDGDDGSTVGQVTLPAFGTGRFGPYVGAVDPRGGLWTMPRVNDPVLEGVPRLHRVDPRTLEVASHSIPEGVAPYGLTIDVRGRVWVTANRFDDAEFRVGVARFDPADGSWVEVPGFYSESGLVQGPDGRLWASPRQDPAALVAIDPETLSVTTFALPDGPAKGLAFDRDGYLWAVVRDPPVAHKIDPRRGIVVGAYEGLHSPYTHSDMSGWVVGRVLGCAPPPG